jgi:hypothetical protein
MFKYEPRRTIKPKQGKKIPVQPSLPKDTHDKLKKLAISCNMTKTKLSEKILTIAVNHPTIIKHLQDTYNTDDFYRIAPIINGEKVDY